MLAGMAVTIPFFKWVLREAILVLRDTLMLRESQFFNNKKDEVIAKINW